LPAGPLLPLAVADGSEVGLPRARLAGLRAGPELEPPAAAFDLPADRVGVVSREEDPRPPPPLAPLLAPLLAVTAAEGGMTAGLVTGTILLLVFPTAW